MDNEILTELEKLQGVLEDRQAALHDIIDLQMRLIKNHVYVLRRKIELEQEKMGLALEGKK